MQELLTRHHERQKIRSSKRLARYCMRSEVGVEIDSRHLNNDPLAHAALLLREGGTPLVWNRIRDEVVTDLAERSPEAHFQDVFEYRLVGGDLVTSSGVSLRQTYQNGLEAARRDGMAYGISRAEALQAQLPFIIDWAASSTDTTLAFFSLRPSETELAIDQQRRLNFKPERDMSSNWLFEKTNDGRIRMHAFSLDGHSMERHRQLLQSLELPICSSTTLQEVSNPYLLPIGDGPAAVELIRSRFDTADSYFGVVSSKRQAANELVKQSTETIALYEAVVQAVAVSLPRLRMSRELRAITKQFAHSYGGYDAPVALLNRRLYQSFTLHEAAAFIDYLRSQALPHYIYRDGRLSGMSIAESGAVSVASGERYDGACPSSLSLNNTSRAEVEQRRLEFYLFRRRPLKEKVFTSQFCPCCLPKPEKNVSVKAWMGEGFIGCDDCGHILDICTQEVYEQGRPRRKPAKAASEKK